MWYRFSQTQSDDLLVKKILDIKYPGWETSLDKDDKILDIVDNLDTYQKQYEAQLINEPQQIQTPLETQQTPSTQMLPPIHEHCHCYIEQMPGGRQIWQFSEKCCQQCRDLAAGFNKTQFTAFGI